MRKLGHGIAVGVLVLFVGRTPGWNPAQEPAFALAQCGSDATDIVLTDADGCVLECWRGELRPGELVRLGPARLSLANALPWEHLRLRPDRSLSVLYRVWDADRYALRAGMMRYYRPSTFDPSPPPLPPLPPGPLPTATDEAEAALRFILFLRKEGTTGPGVIWMPAAAPFTVPRDDGFRYSGPAEYFPLYLERRAFMSSLPRDVNCDFTTSVAAVEGGRVVALREPASRFSSNFWKPQETIYLAKTLLDFEDEARRLPAPKPRPAMPRQPELDGSLRRRWDSGTFTRYPPFHPPGTHP